MSVTFTQLFADSPDIEAILGPMQRLYEHDRIAFDKPAALAALHGLLNDPKHGIVWAMKEEESVIGYAVVTFGYSLEFHGVDAFLDEIYICESHRGIGLGRQAIELAEEACRQRGVRALHLEVERDNTGAQAVYRKLGFRDHDRYLLTKWISL